MDKVGFFLCTGCGIGDAVDADELLKVARKEGKAVCAKAHEQLCTAEGIKLVRDEIAAQGLDAIAIAACSQREMTHVLRFPEVVMERVGIRELVAWTCKADDEDRQMLAEDYVKMYCVKAAKNTPPKRLEPEVTRSLLVIGGGVAGMNAALEAAASGYQVVLVEKSAQLGGLTALWHKRLPRGGAFAAAEPNDIAALVAAVEENKAITVAKSTTVASIEGAPGAYDVKLEGAVAGTYKIGAIVLAVGATPYDAAKLTNLGYGATPDVMTGVEFEKLAKSGELVRPSDGKAIESVLFVQCAGSRDSDHLPYCSTVCCAASIKQAGYVKEANPKARTYVLYKDVRTPGLMENFYREAQKGGTVFVKGTVKSVEKKNGAVQVVADDALSNDELQFEVDVVVLATGLEPATKDGASILNLAYRQGKEMPTRAHGFPNSHFICFPYETQRTGIYAAGTVRQPMDADAASTDGIGAALKAIQCVESASRGEAVHPRASDITWPDFFLSRCTQCKRCTDECPFGTLDEDEKGTPKPNPTRCRRCGVCMGACPERIISFANYSVDMVGSMIKAISVPEEFDEKPRVLCLICENDTLPAIDLAAQLRMEVSPWVRFIPLRCLGSMNLQWVNDALIKGIDGVMLIGCKFGDDYQCHFVKGSELCSVRLGKIQETLTRLMLEPERIKLQQFELGDAPKLPGIINEFVEKVVDLGPNPNKGF